MRVTISDATNAMFLPSTYLVEDVVVEEGPNINDILEATTYEGLYTDLAREGEKIIVSGKLEKFSIYDDIRNGEEYHRVLIGSPEASGTDFIKLELAEL